MKVIEQLPNMYGPEMVKRRLDRGMAVVDHDYFQTLRKFADACEARTVLEIGVGPEGNSAKIFASSLCRRLPATVISIDIDEDRPRPQDKAEVARTGVTWEVVHGDSLTVPIAPQTLDLLYVDGDHDYEYALRDFLRFEPMVKPGGYILMDDYPAFEGVADAVAELEDRGWYGLYLPYSPENGHVIWRKPGDIAPWVTDRNK